MTTETKAAALERVLAELLDSTGASRVTLRVDAPDHGFQVNIPAAEARAPGVKSLMKEGSLDQRAAETVKWLEREKRMLVQNDVHTDGPPPPPALVEIYGTQAQMLGPLFREDHLAGWVSVHENRGPRAWRDQDKDALSKAMSAAYRVLYEPG